jgi:anti-sigma factor RsiW
MKPCAQNQKLIVWLTLNALDARQTRQLQAHLETCEGCRRYLAEISSVTERLAEQENLDIQASESFHRKVAGRLRTIKSDSIGEILAAYIRGTLLNWRVAIPTIAALVLVCVTVAILRQQPPEIVSSPRPSIRTVSVSSADSDPAPTIANYQRVANQSLAKLDALLTRQGNRPLPPMPIYTASTFGLANESF